MVKAAVGLTAQRPSPVRPLHLFDLLQPSRQLRFDRARCRALARRDDSYCWCSEGMPAQAVDTGRRIGPPAINATLRPGATIVDRAQAMAH
ncbi:hypothetical protein [Xanthomonas arboricola]|uniref:hypothetical protein n=1 Tax=Xanthomonas arboricola TaxID=56448 RepID=UPI0011AF4E4C|nr:hypothetical protein [Xanthomonas arboricola]